MIEVIVTSGLACAFCAIWYSSVKKLRVFQTKIKTMNEVMDEFIRINDIEYIDFELLDKSDITKFTETYLKSNVIEWIGKEIEKGYDLYRMKVKKGYNSLTHRHNFSDEFFYILSGEICISCNEDGSDRDCMSDGEYFFLETKKFHHIVAKQDSDFIVIAKPSLFRRF